MNPQASPDSENGHLEKIQKWLGRRILLESLYRFLEGTILWLIGFLLINLVTYLAVLFLSFVFSSIGTPSTHNIFLSVPSFLLFESIVFLIVIGVTQFGSKQNPWTYFDNDSFNVSHDILPNRAELKSFAFQVIFAGGPWLLLHAGDSFGKSIRLSRLDVPEVTTIILWLWKRGKKASVHEVTAAFPEINAIKVLPQLRDIPGIVWLPKVNGVIILSSEFRILLASITATKPPPVEEPKRASYREEQRHRTPPPQEEVYDEKAEWYRTLGLPPYAPLHIVKKRYRQLVKQYHPDLQAQTGQKDDNLIKQINIAYHNIIKESAQ